MTEQEFAIAPIGIWSNECSRKDIQDYLEQTDKSCGICNQNRAKFAHLKESEKTGFLGKLRGHHIQAYGLYRGMVE